MKNKYNLKLGIVIIGYSNINGIKRLLSSLNSVVFGEDELKLIFSIDYSGKADVTNLANAFNAFYQGEAHLYMRFLQGKSQYMLVENVPDSEISENLSREANPDYDVMKAQQQQTPIHDQDSTLIMSKMFESMIKPIEAAHAREVAVLNQQIATLESKLADRKSIIDLQADKIKLQDDKIKSQADEIARLQKAIDDLRAMPSSYDIEEYIRNNPFPVGVAEKQEQPRAQV